MREQLAAWNSVVGNLVLVGVCAAIGVVALPLAFGIDRSAAAAWPTAIWLLAAIIVSLPVLLLARPLGDALALAWDRGLALPSQSRLVARLLMLGLALIIAQASLRRPVALLLGGGGSAASVEGAIAALALAAVLALLVWAYDTARPMLQALALRALDAAIPTVNAPAVAEPTHTISLGATGQISSLTDAATLGVVTDDDPTRRAPCHDDPSPGAPCREDEPTLVSTRDDDPTVRALREDEATLVSTRDNDPTVLSPRVP